MGNNPVMMVDPDGELAWFIPIIAGAIINTTMQGISGNIKNFGDFSLSMGIGALSGLAGLGAGQLVAGAVGTIGLSGGALTGAAGGFAGGFVGGAGNSWAGGASFANGLEAGIKAGGYGALVGGAIGGASGMTQALKRGGNFWNGKNATSDFLIGSESSSQIGEGLEYSNEYARGFSDEHFGKNIKGLNKLYADGSMPEGYTMKDDMVYTKAGKPTGGTTVYRGGNKSDVYLYKAAFTGKERLYLTMGHEYLHAAYSASGPDYRVNKEMTQHASINKWQYEQARLWGFDVDRYYASYLSYKGYYNSAFDYKKFGFFVLNHKPW